MFIYNIYMTYMLFLLMKVRIIMLGVRDGEKINDSKIISITMVYNNCFQT